MAQEGNAVKRMPGPLADLLKKAGEGSDPQASFARDFGGGAIEGPSGTVDIVARAPESTSVIPAPSAISESQRGRGGQARENEGRVRKVAPESLTKKTYRLRPDQYVTLAMLEARLLESRHTKVGASELAREAFDLLFARHKKLITGTTSEGMCTQ